MPIIVINGPSGAGKSTLGLQLKKFAKVIETDDIDDAIMLKLMKGKSDKDLPNIFKQREKEYVERLENLINEYAKSNKWLILVGILHCKKELYKNIEHKYYIDIDPTINFQQLIQRTLNDVCKHKDSIIKLFKDSNLDIADKVLLHKYKMRTPFPIDYKDYCKNHAIRKNKHKKQGYLVLNAKVIYQTCEKLII